MDKIPNSRSIEVLIFEGVNILDVAGPVQAFEAARYKDQRIYTHRYVSLDGKPMRASCGLLLTPDQSLSSSSNADLLIPGGCVDPLLYDSKLLDAVAAKAREKGDGRLISICSGALILAAAGVLDGQIATTHWSREEIAVRKYPKVRWDLDRIYAETGHIYTSAGVTTGIDLALAIIRKDCGNDVALDVARELVVQLRRTGGQSQYAMHLAGQFTPDDSLTRLIEQIVARPDKDWTLDALGRAAGMNSRTLSRRFNRYLSISPAQFVEKTRVDHARGLLSENIPLQTVAAKSGFGDLQRMRRAFQRRFGVNLGEYISVFGDMRKV